MSGPPQWRNRLQVHPAAEVFPLMQNEELADLAADIKQNGLRNRVVLWRDTSESHVESGQWYLLDGRNRLNAMEQAGLRIPTPEDESGKPVGESVFTTVESHTWSSANMGSSWRKRASVDPVAYVISANIRRRHLTKSQQARLIARAAEAGKTDLATMARSVKRGTDGRVRGSTKDPVKAKVLEEAKKLDISERTAERALAEERAAGKPKQPTAQARRPRPEKTPDPLAVTEIQEIADLALARLADQLSREAGHGLARIKAEITFGDGNVAIKQTIRGRNG